MRERSCVGVEGLRAEGVMQSRNTRELVILRDKGSGDLRAICKQEIIIINGTSFLSYVLSLYFRIISVFNENNSGILLSFYNCIVLYSHLTT